MRGLLAISLLLFALPVAGQQRQTPAQEQERLKPPDYSEFERLREKWLQEQEENAREEGNATPNLGPPAVVPEGWLHDYDYSSNLFEYLIDKHQAASSSNRNVYLYPYADWNDACVAFRKAASRRDYRELFRNNEIIMVEFVFLKRMYGARFTKLPVFLKVHADGSLGPEYVRPVASRTEHPRRAYHKLKSFLESNDETGGSSPAGS